MDQVGSHEAASQPPLGHLRDQLEVPDDFDTIQADQVRELFEGHL